MSTVSLTSPGSGWVIFASMMMVLAGTFGIINGIAALVTNEIYVVGSTVTGGDVFVQKYGSDGVIWWPPWMAHPLPPPAFDRSGQFRVQPATHLERVFRGRQPRSPVLHITVLPHAGKLHE